MNWLGRWGAEPITDVRAAMDRETGQQVVLKRPTPQTVKRQMHGPTEERTTRALEAYERAGQHCPAVSRVIGVTDVAVHDDYFGDDANEPYRVRVEERASGIPLVGDPMSRILRVPIGLGQTSLRCIRWRGRRALTIGRCKRSCWKRRKCMRRQDTPCWDLGPHNVF